MTGRRNLPHRSAVRIRPWWACLVALVVLSGATASPATSQGVKLENEAVYGFALFDLLELAPGLDGRPLRWDMLASVGKQYDRFWIKSDGDVSTSARAGKMELQGLYSRLVAPFWEAQVGARLDVGYEGDEIRTRAQLVLGLQGLAPYWFELEPAIFVSQDGDVSASLSASYDLFVTQRLIFQPRLDATAAVQDAPEWWIGSGLSSVALGARLRYELKREFAPYVGVGWTRLAGATADLARGRGEAYETWGFVAGVRAWR